jgi:uracil-DNA glycosylase
MKRRIPTSLDEHRQALEACRRCGHPESIRPIVSLARRPRVMLVGQAPGKVECEGGKPFAGRAGRTLFRWLERAGVNEDVVRDRIYISAITRCFPGTNPSGRGDRVPSPAEQQNCAGWLDAELAIVRPKLLIPVGRLAISRFLGEVPLDAVIGSEHVVRHGAGVAVAIPLPHPSGASSWIHQGDHPRLLDRAIERLADRFRALGIASAVSRSVA